MGKGDKQAGPAGLGDAPSGQRGPTGLKAGSDAAQALPPAVAEYKDTVEKKPYSWLEGKLQIVLCRVKMPKPDFSWTLKKIREETGNADQLGFTDCSFESDHVSIPKAESAGYFSAHAALKTVVMRLPKELDVTDAQIKLAETQKNEAKVKELKAKKACRDHLVAHEEKHVQKAWDALSSTSLGWDLKLGTLSSDTAATKEHLTKALDEGDAKGPTKIAEASKKWDDDDLGPLRSRMRAEHIFVNSGKDATFDYIEPKES
jgi:hypothetical protein